MLRARDCDTAGATPATPACGIEHQHTTNMNSCTAYGTHHGTTNGNVNSCTACGETPCIALGSHLGQGRRRYSTDGNINDRRGKIHSIIHWDIAQCTGFEIKVPQNCYFLAPGRYILNVWGGI